MGTRSDIIVKKTDGTYARVYCHWDGYLSHNGVMLQDHYNSQAKAEKLVKLGDISLLAPKCIKPKGHTFDSPVKGYCIYYERDRGETGTGPKGFGSLNRALREDLNEYTYYWDGTGWLVMDEDGKFVDLAEAIKAEAAEKEAAKAA